MSLNIYYQNTNGLRTKLNDFYLASTVTNADVICITESYLNNNINSAEVVDCNIFDIHRKDRNLLTNIKKDGGGVFVAVKKNLISKSRENWSCDGICEDLWVTVYLGDHKNLHICCVYVPPHASVNNLKAHLNKITDIMSHHPGDVFLVLGDYNIPGLVWSRDPTGNFFVASNVNDDFGEALIDTSNFLDLNQFNGISNVNDKFLDLVFCSPPCNVHVSNCSSPFVQEDRHHRALDIYLNLNNNIKLKSKNGYSKYDFRSADYNVINNELSNIDWQGAMNNSSPDEAVRYLYDTLNFIITNHVRLKHVKGNHPVWFSRRTLNLIKNKDKMHRRWKKYNDEAAHDAFSYLRRDVKISVKQDYKNYVASTESNIKNNIKPFWSFISNKTGSRRLPSVVTYNGQTLSDDNDICEAFCQYFSSVFESNTTPSNIHGSPVKNFGLNINFISLKQIEQEIDNLDINKSAGPDEIPAIFIKSCKQYLTLPLFIIYNKSLSCGYFPSDWKRALIVPVFKSGSKGDVSNYRPISLLSLFGKIFEAIITNELFFKIKHLLSENQHGFYQGRSIITNLMPFLQTTLEVMDSKLQVDAVYTDFSKAFDKVHHPTLLIKLENFGIHGELLGWIKSYLTNRSQCVKMNNSSSKYLTVTSGIPQGSHMGPLLFCLFINDIGSCFCHSDYSLFADDLKVYKSIESLEDCAKLQEDLSRFFDYCKSHRLSLNINKCSQITFSRKVYNIVYNYDIGGSSLNVVNQVKDLGIILDTKLSFDAHIELIVQKSMRNLGFILRNTKNFTNPFSIIILFNALVRSHLEYGSILWSPQYYKYIDRIEKVQRKLINVLNYRFNRNLYYESYENRLSHYNLKKLCSRRIVFSVLFLYKLLNNTINSSYILGKIFFSISQYFSRSSNLFYISSCHTNSACNSPIRMIQKNYNDYFSHIDLFNISLYSLKRQAYSVIC